MCTKLSIEDVEFNQNSCDGEGCVLLSANSTLQDVRVLRNREADSSSTLCSMFSVQEGSQAYARSMSTVRNEIRIFYVHNSILTLGESYFEENMREQYSTSSHREIRGGVVFAGQSLLSIRNSIFKRNYATRGGAIYATFSEIDTGNSTFDRNSAPYGQGGALFVEHGEALNLHSAYLIGNLANEGGALHATSVSSMLKDCQFVRNNASFGGACVFNDRSLIQVERVIFEENSAYPKWGGVTAMSHGSIIEVNDSTFQNNIARDNGGLIDASFNCEVYFTNVVSMNNTAGGYGGSIHVHTDTKVVVLHSNFSSEIQTLFRVLIASNSCLNEIPLLR